MEKVRYFYRQAIEAMEGRRKNATSLWLLSSVPSLSCWAGVYEVEPITNRDWVGCVQGIIVSDNVGGKLNGWAEGVRLRLSPPRSPFLPSLSS
jgi:hypothetical protein